ncbi:histidine kinase [Streptomyces sp. NPDC048737]|uniref:sensor histidine kinase n=1 Tax=unclassified Streptomyces TaxID=2593676 RepID=UPI0034373976
MKWHGVGSGAWRGALTWWSGKGTSARVELYTRWTFHFVALIELIGVACQIAFSQGPGWSRAGLSALISLHAVLTGVTCSRALDTALDRWARPSRFIVASTVFSVLTVAVALMLGRSEALPAQGLLAPAVLGPIIFGSVPLGLTVPLRRVVQLVVWAAVTLMLVMPALSFPWRTTLDWAFTSLAGGLVMAFAARFSVWLLDAVRELDSARMTQARLAVAEERLRIGRDMHDVLGRNLTVIALKGELAVELVRRGSSAAVEQLVEVQRIARESQREVREVVRGYREADLHTEIAGAKDVLQAAGIICDIEDTCTEVLPKTTSSMFGWVIREGTTNILRHSSAGHCVIRLRSVTEAGALVSELMMENDGAIVGNGTGNGSGLLGLVERLASHGGTLRAELRPGGIFRVVARVPSVCGVTECSPESWNSRQMCERLAE